MCGGWITCGQIFGIGVKGIDFRTNEQDTDTEVQPQHQHYDSRQAPVHVGEITEIGKVQRESIGKQQPAYGCEDGPWQLLPGVLLLGRDNGVEKHKGE